MLFEFFFFFFNDTATTDIYTLSLHDALPICPVLHPAKTGRPLGQQGRTTGATTLATVVVVDDQPYIRKFLRKVLTARGHQVLDEGSGEDALALCGTVHPDILIADLLMSGVDGYELVRRLRSNPDTAGIRVIFFTGLPQGSQAQCLAEQWGVHQVLLKPASPDGISQAVDLALAAPVPSIALPNAGFDREHAQVLGEMLLQRTDELEGV